MSFFRRILRAIDPNPDGITETDWVRRIYVDGTGRVESVRGNTAVVNFFDGKPKVIIPCAHLRRVRDCDDFDKRGTL